MQSMNPAPVRSRSSLTASAEMSAMLVRCSCSCAAGGRGDPGSIVASSAVGRAARRRSAGGRRLFLLGGFAGELGGDLLRAGLGRRRRASAPGRSGGRPGRRSSSSSASGSNVSAAPPARAATSSSDADLVVLGLGRRSRPPARARPARAARSCWPSMQASAISWQSSRIDRIASSLAGMMWSISSGSTFVSPVADDRDLELVRLGDRDPLAVRVDDEDRARARASSCACRRPSASSLVSSSVSFAASFFGIRSKSPACWRASSCSSRPIRFLIVVKFVSMPPSQRLLTYGWPARVASWAMGSWACFFVPTNRTYSPRATVSRTKSSDDVEVLDGLGEIDDVDPVALGEDERAHLGIPAARLVAEVDTGFEQLPHRDGRHGERPPVRFRSSADLVAGFPVRLGSRRRVSGPAPSRSERSACDLRRPDEPAAGGCRGLARGAPECSTGSGRALPSPAPVRDQKADRWWRITAGPPPAPGSTTTRSKRTGSFGGSAASSSHRHARPGGAVGAWRGRSSPRPGRTRGRRATGPRRTTSVARRCRDRSRSGRARRGRHWTLRATIVQPTAVRAQATAVSAASPSSWAAVRLRSNTRRWSERAHRGLIADSLPAHRRPAVRFTADQRDPCGGSPVSLPGSRCSPRSHPRASAPARCRRTACAPAPRPRCCDQERLEPLRVVERDRNDESGSAACVGCEIDSRSLSLMPLSLSPAVIAPIAAPPTTAPTPMGPLSTARTAPATPPNAAPRAAPGSARRDRS